MSPDQPCATLVVSPQIAWKRCLVFALLVIAVAAIMMPIFPKEGAGYPPGLGQPVFAFEMAESAEDLTLVFGAPDDAQRSARIEAMDCGNRWDYAFLFAYGGYQWAFLVAVAAASRQQIWKWLAWFGIVAGVCDAVENAILLNMTAHLETSPYIDWLRWPVWTKFLSMMVCAAATGIFLLTRPSTGWKLAGIAALGGSFTVGAAFVSPVDWGWAIGNGLAVVWLLQLVFCLDQLRRSADQTSAGRTDS